MTQSVAKPEAEPSSKGYVFGFLPRAIRGEAGSATNDLAAHKGRLLAKQQLDQAVYTENTEGYEESFAAEFPSVRDALEWYKSNNNDASVTTSKAPLVILPGPDFGDYTGFSTFFIKVHDKEAFKAYAPQPSLELYKAKRSFVKIDEAALAVGGAEAFDAAVLIAFKTPELGRDWIQSDDYKAAGALRIATTSGPGAIIGPTD